METSCEQNSFLANFPAGAFPLSKVVVTEDLKTRPYRAPDYKGESEAYRELSKLLSVSPKDAMNGLVEQVVKLLGVDSAGISLVDVENGNDIFRWLAIAGSLKPFLNGIMPRHFSPCGEVCKKSEPILMRHMVDHYKYVEILGHTLYEVLLVPFYKDGQAIGTVWGVSHGKHKEFDSEDLRILASLAEFTSGIVQAQYRSEELLKSNLELNSEKVVRERLISALSHDLRSPITSTKINAQMLARKIDSQMIVLANRIVSSMNRADSMIRDLLDLNMIKAGERFVLNLGDHNLYEVIKNVTDELTMIHGERFVIRAADNIQGRWDSDAIRRILENLLTNAIKYGDENTPITISVQSNEKEIEFAVHNLGTAISRENCENLFVQYQRAESAIKSSQQGWGIGLMIVRGLAQSMDGAVFVTSTELEGTTFFVKLPRFVKDLE